MRICGTAVSSPATATTSSVSSSSRLAASLTTVVETGLANQAQQRALEFFANYEGDDPLRLSKKQKAMDKLESQAGI